MKVLLWIYFSVLTLVSVFVSIALLLTLFGSSTFDIRILVTEYYAIFGSIGIYSFNTGGKKFEQSAWKNIYYIATVLLTGVVLSLIYGVLKDSPAPIGTSVASLVIYFGPLLYLFHKLSVIDLEEHIKTVRVGQTKESYQDLAALLFQTKDRYSDIIISANEGTDTKKRIEFQKAGNAYELSLIDEPGSTSKHQFSNLLSLVQHIEENTPFRVRDFL